MRHCKAATRQQARIEGQGSEIERLRAQDNASQEEIAQLKSQIKVLKAIVCRGRPEAGTCR